MPIKNEVLRRQYDKEYRLKNLNKIKQKRKEWEDKNKEYLKEYHRNYHKRWYELNREKRTKELREYDRKNKEGVKERAQRYNKKHKDRVIEFQKKYSLSLNGVYRTYRHQAKRRNLPFEITLEDLESLITSDCKYCGEKNGKIGIDRIDNDCGYTKQNVAPCCKTCNFMKKDMTLEKFISHTKKIASYNS